MEKEEIKVVKRGIGFKPATEEDVEKVEKLMADIAPYFEDEVPGLYPCGHSFCLDTNEDYPEEVNEILNKYKPLYCM